MKIGQGSSELHIISILPEKRLSVCQVASSRRTPDTGLW